jgi:hypothetical protein
MPGQPGFKQRKKALAAANSSHCFFLFDQPFCPKSPLLPALTTLHQVWLPPRIKGHRSLLLPGVITFGQWSLTLLPVVSYVSILFFGHLVDCCQSPITVDTLKSP